jgi:transposase
LLQKTVESGIPEVMTTKLDFTPEIQTALGYERFHHPVPKVQRRMEVLWFKSHGLSHGQIAKLADVSENTMLEYFRLYAEGGIEKLKEVNFYRQVSKLQTHASTLETHFKNNPPASIKEAQHTIEKLTGIKRGETQVRRFLKKNLKLRYRKVGMIPAKADVEKQAEFIEKTLYPRLDEAKAGERNVYFMDASHFVLAPFLGYLWSVARIFIKAPAGRQRFNVLGALNAMTHELITVNNDTYITATQVCELLYKLSSINLNIPITIFLDNARYQKCALVQNLAMELKIELCYLPTYSPNLNLIERLWKFVKKDCLYSKYYENFSLFKSAIIDCLNKTHTTHKKALNSLLTFNFQTFEEI